jgi:uncharacterized protein (TIGR02145 family)
MKSFLKIIIIVFLSASFIAIMQYCKKPSAPTITTSAVSEITQTTALSGGNITNNGGDDVTARGICWSTTSNPSITSSKTSNGTGNGSFTSNITGLTANTTYLVRAYATNSEGTAYGVELTFTTIAVASTVPGAPTISTATAGNAQASIAFTAPASDGGSAITGYTATSNPGGLTGVGTASPITVTGLTNGTAYTFTVTATNANGIGPASTASNSVTTSTVPDAPTIGTATAGNTQATIAFTAPVNNGGSAITGYKVTSNPGGFTATGTASPITVTGLNNGTPYTFTATATNTNGTSLASSASNSVTPSAVPGAPIIGTATKGNAQATVTFTAPGSNGGSAITGYTVTSGPGGFTASGAASPITVTGLTNGTAYTFTVTATNVNGTGPASVVSNSVTPSTVPGAPIIGTATAGVAQATVTFTEPVSDGGSAITGYTATSSPGGLTGIGTASPITVTGLTNGTAYTFTVIATNANGISLASSASNSVTPSTVVSDIDGNVYNTVVLGAQVWMKENLKTTKYNDGTSIPNVTVNATWDALTTPAYCWYNNDVSYKNNFGALYNWYAVNTSNLCPTGWHVPVNNDWTIMTNYLIANGYNYDGTTTGNKIAKSVAAASTWNAFSGVGAVGNTDYTGKINASGFTALSSGGRYFSGGFSDMGNYTTWWCSTDYSTTMAYRLILGYSYAAFNSPQSYYKQFGFSVRCVRN